MACKSTLKSFYKDGLQELFGTQNPEISGVGAFKIALALSGVIVVIKRENTVLARLRRNWRPRALLVGM